MTLTDATVRWFQDRRGIDRATLEAFGVQSEDEGVTLPYPDGAVKHRKTLEKVDGKHKMWFDPRTPDSRQRLFIPPNFSSAGKWKIVWEGESDTMACWQNAPDEAKPHIAGIGGAAAFGPKGLTDEAIQEYFGDAELVFFVMDNEDPYEGNEAYETVQRAKKQITQRLGRKARFVELPGSAQDGCEFWLAGFDWAAFRILLDDAKKVTYNFRAIDFSKERPVREWLVDGFLSKGEIAMFSGDGGSGKSLLLQDLAIHMITGKDEWLGMKLAGQKVMIIDQENPEDEVWERLFALGMTKESTDNLRYVWYQHVLLDDPDQVRKLYEDVANFGPDLLTLDSMSRMHLSNENANEEMNPLINDAIFPLARTLGTTVAMIHHVRKDGRTRGATAIRNAVDITYDVALTEDKKQQIVTPDKQRSITAWGHALYLTQRTDDEGKVRITTELEDLPL